MAKTFSTCACAAAGVAPALSAAPQAARYVYRPLPEVFGLGMITEIPWRPRSAQSRMLFGFPLRTRMTDTDVVGALLSGNRFAQSAGTSCPRSWRMSMSLAWFIVITSASSPSMTERACRLLPPCDMLRVSGPPPFAFHHTAKAAL